MVEGMTCGNCARKVQQAAASVPGTRAAVVDLSQGRLQVQWSSGSSPHADKVVQALAKVGFPAKPESAQTGSDNASPTPSPGAGWQRAVWVGSLCTAPLMIGEWVLGLHHSPGFSLISALLGTIVAVVCGHRFVRGAWNQAKVGSFGMDALVTLGAGTAYLFSVVGLLMGFQGHLYFLESSAIVTFISLGHWLEQRVGAQAEGALRALLQLTPSKALRMNPDGVEEEVPVSRLNPGDRIVIRAGDRIPADGLVLSGTSSVNESMLTGESKPVLKRESDRVYAGTLNVDGRLIERITASGRQTALAQIIAAVQRAQSSRAGIQRLADRVSQIFVPGVILVALATFLAWGFFPERLGGWHQNLSGWLWTTSAAESPWVNAMVYATAVLIVACPCAMGLATPAALMAAANAAYRRGFLIRDAIALEKAGTITTVVFDKTGTLTVGHPTLVHSEWASGLGAESQGRVKTIVASLASSSRHPLSRELARLSDVRESLTDFKETPGSGLSARLGESREGWALGSELRLGSLVWLREAGVDVSGLAGNVGSGREAEASLVGLAIGNALVVCFYFEDTLKRETLGVLQSLRTQGLSVRLISGDHASAAEKVGMSVGFQQQEIFADVRPEGKAQLIRGWQDAGDRVAFVGDGINDGPALAQADLGVAVSRASDVARESADLILLQADLEAVPESLSLASRTLTIIRQNLFWALCYNLVAVPLAALGFLHPMLCAVTMGLSDVLVVGNSLRLLRAGRPASGKAARIQKGS